VKQTKPALSFYVQENAFHSLSPDWVVAAPELGFLFPAFDDRSANIYGALYYSKDLSDSRQDFMDAVFHVPAPMAPETQKETFQTVLGESLEKECSLQVVQAVQGELYGLMEEHKLNHEDEPLTISKGTVSNVLSVCGVDKERVNAFEDAYQEQFGGDARLSPRNLMDPKQMEIKTPDVTIRVSTERSELVQTKIIDGAKYILIRAEDGVEVNGVPIHIE
jgi:hypothetical protein